MILLMKNNLVHVYTFYGWFEEALILAQEVFEERKCVLSDTPPLIEDSIQTIEFLKTAITELNERINVQLEKENQ